MNNYRTEDDFYFHEKFGKVPIGWDVKSMGDCFDFFPTSSYSREKLTEIGDCLYVHYGDIHTKFHEFIDFNIEQLPFVTKEMAARFTKLEEGDLIIADASEDYDGVGKAVEVLNLQDKKAISGLHTLHLRSKDECFVNGFKGYVLNNDKVRLDILRSTTGIKVYSVSKSGLKRILLPKPPKAEQEAIALILSKVDDAIRASNKTIKAAEKLKRGFMQNLISGKLKPDGTWRTEDEFYKDEKFGNIPIGWELKKLNDVFLVNQNSLPNKTDQDYTFRYITIESVSTEKIDFESCPEYQFKESPGRARRIIKDGDILVSGVRPNLKAFAIFENPNSENWICSTGFYVLTAKEKQNNLFHFYQILSEIGESQFHSYVAGSNYPAIGDREIKRMRLYCPSYPEQCLIVESIKSVATEIIKKETKIKTLQRLKKSLMQNLLSGKMKVNIKEVENILKLENN